MSVDFRGIIKRKIKDRFQRKKKKKKRKKEKRGEWKTNKNNLIGATIVKCLQAFFLFWDKLLL